MWFSSSWSGGFLAQAIPSLGGILLQMFVYRAMFCIFSQNNVMNGYEVPKLVSKCLFGPCRRWNVRRMCGEALPGILPWSLEPEGCVCTCLFVCVCMCICVCDSESPYSHDGRLRALLKRLPIVVARGLGLGSQRRLWA